MQKPFLLWGTTTKNGSSELQVRLAIRFCNEAIYHGFVYLEHHWLETRIYAGGAKRQHECLETIFDGLVEQFKKSGRIEWAD